MKSSYAIIAVAILASSFAAFAHDDDDGHGRRGERHAKYKEEYREANCKVKRKFKNGEVEEKRKCKGFAPEVVHAPHLVHVPVPVVVVPAPAVVDPGIVIQGTIRVR